MNDATMTISDVGVASLLGGLVGVVAELEVHGRIVQAQAKQIVPVDTGALQESIVVESDTDSRGPVVYVGSHLPYAIYVELGTSRMAAQPYLRPALGAAGGNISDSTAVLGAEDR
jgi:HK97 gp10 family phage protein